MRIGNHVKLPNYNNLKLMFASEYKRVTRNNSRKENEASLLKKDGFEKFFALDKRIRFSGLVDPKGILVGESGMRKDLQSLEPEGEDRRLYVQLALAASMDRTWDKYYGKTRALVILKEKVIIFVYSLPNLHTLVVAAEPDLPITKMRKLRDLVEASGIRP